MLRPVQFAKGTTDTQKQMYKESVEKAWSGQFGSMNVTLNVEERSRSQRNRIKFSEKSGTSYVLFGRYMTLFKEKSDNDTAWVETHETGHLMKLNDEYKEGKYSDGTRKTTPNAGWKNNVMAEFNGAVEEKNINDILSKNKITILPEEEK
jgi:hypothetical protein